MSELKLLPCPFCGGIATIQQDTRYPRYGKKDTVKAYEPICTNTDCLIYKADNVYFTSEEEAIAAWNRRAQPENEPLTCKDCVYWKDRQVQLRDGSCRDYLPNEPWSVTADVGINVASHCTLHGFDNESGSWFWARAEDFCSRGIRKPERSEGE